MSSVKPLCKSTDVWQQTGVEKKAGLSLFCREATQPIIIIIIIIARPIIIIIIIIFYQRNAITDYNCCLMYMLMI